GNCFGKQMRKMYLCIMNVEMLHISISSCMEDYHQSYYLTTAHCRLSLGCIAKEMFFDGIFETKAKFINKIKNFSNFRVSKSHVLVAIRLI
ncbi:MAG TPA: hypothetical protein VD908_00815, partial [Cytophagales bacterium]|nr:hypothetical protein [Cytophagales bacterium]